ncbi:pilus (MSHA type) biogenesis protein MshL [Aestuariibacter salexigens]|uniref:pilus (MSHA type) biogenesis protein MshL n=1 Tax=Aestuariibacter salexigens TaxID=226010 RepID=UPI000427EFC8|nr:pilus (MSHA type) biogenesis protein MshL [Aestuariibacter salexigens]
MLPKLTNSALLVGAVILLTGCQSTQPSHVETALKHDLLTQEERAAAKQPTTLQALPDAVSEALMAPVNASSGDELQGEERFDVLAKDVSAASFFAGLVKDTPYSVAIHPEVNGKISLDLKQVTLPEVFDLVADLYGFEIEQRRTIYRVLPSGMRTETFAVNYLLMQRDGQTQTSIISGGVSQAENGNRGNNNGNFNNFSGNAQNGNNLGGGMNSNNINGTRLSTRSETDFWKELQQTLQSMVGGGDGRSVFVTPQAGLVTVRAMPDEIRAVRDFLQVSEEIVQRQVVLEARILEVVLNDEFQQGINWNQVLANSGSTDFEFSTSAGLLGNDITSSLGGLTTLSFINQDFSGVLSLLSTQGNVQVLSSPRVTATNNQKAVIKVGDDEYFVTDVSSQNTITSTTTSVVPDIELTPFFSGIALDVTPQIDKQGSVLLHVHPSVIETEEQEKVVVLNQEQIVLPLAQSTIRESDTIIRAQSGEIVVIGGLMQSIISETDSKTPLLGDIPLLGNLFKNRREKETKKELIILLKPTVVGPNTWREQIQRSQQQMADWLYVE